LSSCPWSSAHSSDVHRAPVYWEEYPGQQLLIYEGVVRLLKTLPNSDDGAVIHDWLSGTRKWCLATLSMEPDREIGDLLTVFVKEMAKLIECGVLEQDTTYECAINFVKELQKRREALQP